MPDRHFPTSVASAITSLLFAVAVAAASLSVTRYLDGREQSDIRETDRVYLTRLYVDERGQYRDYRDHRVYPDPAARWVLEERELLELKQWIKQHDLVIQTALSQESASKEMRSFKNWLH